jgi:hypothetical protein
MECSKGTPALALRTTEVAGGYRRMMKGTNTMKARADLTDREWLKYWTDELRDADRPSIIECANLADVHCGRVGYTRHEFVEQRRIYQRRFDAL